MKQRFVVYLFFGITRTEPELAGSGTEKMVKPNIALPKRTGLKMTLPKPFKLHQTRSRTNLVILLYLRD